MAGQVSTGNDAEEIRDLCQIAGHKELAEQFIAERTSIAEVRRRLADLNRLRGIGDLCEIAGRPDLTQGFIDRGAAHHEVWNELLALRRAEGMGRRAN